MIQKLNPSPTLPFLSGADQVLSWSQQYTARLIQELGANANYVNFMLPGSSPSRIVLTAATTFYIATNGSDANNGLSLSTPWLTFAHAGLVLAGQYDFGGQTVTLQGVSGHAAFTGAGLNVPVWTGGGSFIYDGAGGSIAATNDNAFLIGGSGTSPGPATIQNVTLSTSGSGDCMAVFRGNNANIGPGVVFGAASQAHIDAEAYATVRAQSSYTITGGAQFHWHVDGSGLIAIFSKIITLSGTPAFSVFAESDNLSSIICPANSFVGSASAGTKRFNVIGNAVISTFSAGINYLPGGVAGTQTGGGAYT